MHGNRGDVEGTFRGGECGEMGSSTDEGGGDYCRWFSRPFRSSMEGDEWQGTFSVYRILM
jgi:hypothetical protein